MNQLKVSPIRCRIPYYSNTKWYLLAAVWQSDRERSLYLNSIQARSGLLEENNYFVTDAAHDGLVSGETMCKLRKELTDEFDW